VIRPELSEKITDDKSFALAVGMMGALSRYADTVAAAVLSGKSVPDLTGFLSEAHSRFEQLASMALAALSESERATAKEIIGTLPDTQDPVLTALVCDQAFVFLQSFLQQDALLAHVRLASARAGLEEASVRAEIDRLGTKPSGLYV
jgi:hypothetical protein